MTDIKVENLTVKLNDKLVLKEISFEFNTSERILILGESGCGKSTLLLSLMGITQRFDHAEVTGDIFIGGKSIKKMKPNEISRILGMVFQDPESQFCSLYPKDEVAFGLENLCVNPALMEELIHRSLKAVDFPKPRYQNAINALSGGEQQRLALASIFAQGAEMFLLDEPTANLDPLGRRQVIAASKVSAEKGKGLLVVEHNLDHWLPYLNRLMVLDHNGTLLYDGNPREIFEKYGEILEEKGIWRPQSVRLYEELKRTGYLLSRVPLNFKELCDENIPKNRLVEAFHKLNHHAEMNHFSNKVILEVNNLSAEYEKNKPVFREINLKIEEGDFVALVGCNGSGKSTLAKAFIRLIEPACGEVVLDGKRIKETKLKDIFHITGYVFQNPEHQFVEDTVWSELAYSVQQLELDEISSKQYIITLLEEFELQSFISNNPFSLSGGQKRRLSVATMLVGNKKLLILDEPTFGQDEKNTHRLMDRLCELNNKGISIVMITHDLDLVEQYANKIAVMHKGSLIFSGEAHDLWNRKNIIEDSGLELPFKIKVLTRKESLYGEYE